MEAKIKHIGTKITVQISSVKMCDFLYLFPGIQMDRVYFAGDQIRKTSAGCIRFYQQKSTFEIAIKTLKTRNNTYLSGNFKIRGAKSVPDQRRRLVNPTFRSTSNNCFLMKKVGHKQKKFGMKKFVPGDEVIQFEGSISPKIL